MPPTVFNTHWLPILQLECIREADAVGKDGNKDVLWLAGFFLWRVEINFNRGIEAVFVLFGGEGNLRVSAVL